MLFKESLATKIIIIFAIVGSFLFGMFSEKLNVSTHLACNGVSGESPNAGSYLYHSDGKEVCYKYDHDDPGAFFWSLITLGLGNEKIILEDVDPKTFFAPTNSGIVYDKDYIWTDRGRNRMKISEIWGFVHTMDAKCIDGKEFDTSNRKNELGFDFFCEPYRENFGESYSGDKSYLLW